MRILLSKDLSSLKNAAEEKIDSEAGQIRLHYVTQAPGQDMVYQQKREEAKLVLSGNAYASEQIPHIVLEALSDNVSVEDKATEIVGQAQLWMRVSALIETQRLSAKKTVRAATSEMAIKQAANVDWGNTLNII